MKAVKIEEKAQFLPTGNGEDREVKRSPTPSSNSSPSSDSRTSSNSLSPPESIL